MLDNELTGTVETDAATQDDSTAAPTKAAASRRRRAAGRPAGPPVADDPAADSATPETAPEATEATAEAPVEDKPKAKRTRKKVEPKVEATAADAAVDVSAADAPAEDKPKAKRTRKRAEPKVEAPPVEEVVAEPAVATDEDEDEAATQAAAAEALAAAAPVPPTMLLFQAPEADAAPPRRRRAAGRAAGAPAPIDTDSSAAPADGDEADAPARATRSTRASVTPDSADPADDDESGTGGRRRSRRRGGSAATRAAEDAPDSIEPGDADGAEETDDDYAADDTSEEATAARRRRRRGGRGRRGRGGRAGELDGAGDGPEGAEDGPEGADAGAIEIEIENDADGDDAEGGEGGSRRRRRRRRRGEDGDGGADDPEQTVTRVRTERSSRSRSTSTSSDDEVTSVRGSTRLEAKKQRRREGREAGRRRVPIITEAEFLARREAVDRVMVVREGKERVQIAVLEDGVLVEHYVNKRESSSLMGDVFLGRVQNVLPSMEAAFVDIGKGRNAVLYAGEVNFDGMEGQPKRIEHALKSGQSVLVQVTKDPIGHKGARLTSQISLPGRYLVYVPEGSMTGISRKLPDTERSRLKAILKRVVPEDAGVIIRTAAEGASEEELARDVEHLAAQWEAIKKKAKTASAPAMLHGEPDLTIRVVRDIFNSDFGSLVVAGDAAWTEVSEYVNSAAPDLADRVSRYTGEQDVFGHYRVEEQIAKGLDRKVWLPSGGSLVIDRTEAMTVVDVNTGKFTGQGGNLEETVTRNNLEAAEEIVRQLRLRDIGGIIVVDFIDMVLESNRELVLRRLVECLGRDRTKHQVAEVTSLGLVQMTRKRVGQGLLEAFSHNCEHCNGRGIVVRNDSESSGAIPKPGPLKLGAAKPGPAGEPGEPGTGRRSRRRRGKGGENGELDEVSTSSAHESVPDEAVALEAETLADALTDEIVLVAADIAEAVAPMAVTASPDDPDAASAQTEPSPEKRPRRRRASSSGKITPQGSDAETVPDSVPDSVPDAVPDAVSEPAGDSEPVSV